MSLNIYGNFECFKKSYKYSISLTNAEFFIINFLAKIYSDFNS